MKIPEDIALLLESEAKRINSPEFIGEDPVQFPRRFERKQDIEITALIAAIIAWGRRSMICRDAERILTLMDHEPYQYLMDRGYEDLDPDMNLHRTFFARDLQWLMRGLHNIYSRYDSIDDFAASQHIGDYDDPAWQLTGRITLLADEASPDFKSIRTLPRNLDQTALKRINMALRWLVRDDGIVDMGIWKSIPKSKLYIPLDVHVGNTARNLGIITRKVNDRKTVNELTAALRTLRPDDPCLYDYALFGIGVEGGNS